jgi:hypothetical protein
MLSRALLTAMKVAKTEEEEGYKSKKKTKRELRHLQKKR